MCRFDKDCAEMFRTSPGCSQQMRPMRRVSHVNVLLEEFVDSALDLDH